MSKIKLNYSADMENLDGESNVCPYCGSSNLDYEALELEGESLYFPVHCNDCENDYKEWHDLVFAGNWGYPIKKKNKKKA